ncbi:hypothetical protein HMPREF0880_04614 [Yokenella regensburgei ATCC 43003]|nr:hypothetical protein HMPREF0880_04614 [Yokenella regensburgei ATCC 43003]
MTLACIVSAGVYDRDKNVLCNPGRHFWPVTLRSSLNIMP